MLPAAVRGQACRGFQLMRVMSLPTARPL